jgi:hypothetical protein
VRRSQAVYDRSDPITSGGRNRRERLQRGARGRLDQNVFDGQITMRRNLGGSLALLTLLLGAGSASAQGLLWSIPDEGQWIRYEGEYTQVVKRPNDATGDLTITWSQHLTIKALTSEDADFQGRTVPCRWIEFKVITGPVKEGIIDAGPGGIRLYKLLVPIEAIEQVAVAASGEVLDIDKVLATHVPVVQGYRKIGDETATEIETGVFQVYPALTLMQHFRSLTNAGDEAVAVLGESFDCAHWQGEHATEDTFSRSTNTTDVWRTDAAGVPFGIAKWTTQLVVEHKKSTDTRATYAPLSEVTEEMTAAEIGTAAESELVID